MPTRCLHTCRVGSQPSVFRKPFVRSTGLPSADGRGMAGSARDVGVTVGIAAAVWNKPEAPAATAGASSLLAPLPVGLLRRFPADRQQDKAGGLRRECCGTALLWDVGRAVETLSGHGELVREKFSRAFSPADRFARPRRRSPACCRTPACPVCRRWCCGPSKSGCPWTRRWRRTTCPSRTS